MVLRE
jgi:hypothetical protein